MYRPRSISRLVLFGVIVVLAPLIAAIVTAVVQVDRLAQRNRITVLESRLATEQSRSLVEQLTEMQRALGQYQVRGDRDFYGIYLERRTIFRNALDNLNDLSPDVVARDKLSAIGAGERALFDGLGRDRGEPSGSLSWDDAASELSRLAGLAREVLAESNQLIENQANNALASAEEVQQILLLLAAAAIVMSVVLATLFVVLVNRPMNELGGAIRRLGAREYEQPISVRGPRDVEGLGRQLDWLRCRILELEAQKTAFLQHISHELKTPLTTIREGAELLVESLGDSAPEEVEISQLMRSSSLSLQKLIEDLLQFARTQEPAMDLDVKDDIDVAALIESLAAEHGVVLAAKDVTLERDLHPVRLRGDENKIRIIVDNLLTNAIKYTPANGSIEIWLRLRDREAVIDVWDSGPGVDESEVELIFEPFRQGQAKHQSSVKGTGLGLSIAKEYVEAHDGYIKILPAARGAHFQVALPLDGPTASTNV